MFGNTIPLLTESKSILYCDWQASREIQRYDFTGILKNDYVFIVAINHQIPASFNL